MELSESRGRLVAVGGAEDKEGECVILKEFVGLARGEKARVVVMTVTYRKASGAVHGLPALL